MGPSIILYVCTNNLEILENETTGLYSELHAIKTQQCEDTQPGSTNGQMLTAKNNMVEE